MTRGTRPIHRKRPRGFTIIELMIVVVIIAILAGIAFPSYSKYVVRSHRRAAQAQMAEIASREQQFFMASRAYADKATLAANGYALPADLTSHYSWDVTVDAGPPPGFTITFTGIGSQQADDGWIAIDAAGTKTSQYPHKW